jgi:hypothetical protein
MIVATGLLVSKDRRSLAGARGASRFHLRRRPETFRLEKTKERPLMTSPTHAKAIRSHADDGDDPLCGRS